MRPTDIIHAFNFLKEEKGEKQGGKIQYIVGNIYLALMGK